MNKRKHKKQAGKNAGRELLILPFTVHQGFDGFIINLFDHNENISVKGLWEKQETVLDLVENLPRFLRWMKKNKHRSLQIHVDGKDGRTLLTSEISHASGELQSNFAKWTAHARPFKNN